MTARRKANGWQTKYQLVVDITYAKNEAILAVVEYN
jgi:hypothetical protein